MNYKITKQIFRLCVNQSRIHLFRFNIKRNFYGIHQFPTVEYRKNNFKLFLIPAGIWSLFFKDKEEETPEDKIINIIKRSILCIQRSEFSKAEQMLHLALRMAQEIQNKDAITYVYDVMANLALENKQYKKAEKLFVTVMQRLLQDGYKEDDIKMLHISSKIAHIAFLESNIDKSIQGFKWTLEKIEAKLKYMKDDQDLYELWGMTKNYYAQLLMQMRSLPEAKQCFSEALDVYTQVHGKINPEVVILLNNLAVVCMDMDDIIGAEVYLTEALLLAKEFPELSDSGIFHANQGLLFIKQGLLQQAKTVCSLAWRNAKQINDQDGIKQADYCLTKLKEMIN